MFELRPRIESFVNPVFLLRGERDLQFREVTDGREVAIARFWRIFAVDERIDDHTVQHFQQTMAGRALLRREVDQVDDRLLCRPNFDRFGGCLLYTSPSPRDRQKSRMPSSA